MDTSKHLILKYGKDITSDVIFCKYNKVTKKYDATFRSGGTYSCSYQTIEWVMNPEIINPALVRIHHGDRELFNIQYICIFHTRMEDCWHIRFSMVVR